MILSHITSVDFELARNWKRLNPLFIECPKRRSEYIANCDALDDILRGKSIRETTKNHDLNRTTLTQMVLKAFSKGPDGQPNAYHACIPYHVRFRTLDSDKTTYPNNGGPYAVSRLSNLYPQVAEKFDNYKLPMLGGRLPAAFTRLTKDILGFLREKGHANEWPFTTPDKGRRAFATHIRDRREAEAKLGAEQFAQISVSKLKRLDDLFQLDPFDRAEFDEHSYDAESELMLPGRDGEPTSVPISKIWGLYAVDANSEALIVWTMVFGGFTALDVAQCFAKSLKQWAPRNLIVPGMYYKDGATMPSNVSFGPVPPRMFCFDNAKQHTAEVPFFTWATTIDAIFNVGKRHTPQDRPHIEGFNKWLDNNLIRELPGGNKPAKARDDKVYTSAYKTKNHPIHIQGLEDVMDVNATEYNVQYEVNKHQNKTPIDVILRYAASDRFWLPTLRYEEDLKKLTSEVKKVTFRGTRRKDETKVVHINLYKVRYRCQALDNKFDLIGRSYQALIDLEDLRTITLVDENYKTFATLIAERPWNVTQHDVTIRKRILGLVSKGAIELDATDCAVAAYAAYTLSHAGDNKAIADQAARLIQLTQHNKLQFTPPCATGSNKHIDSQASKRINRFFTGFEEL